MGRQSGIVRKAEMQFRERLTQALREPLVHFLLAGLAIFLIYGSFGGAVDSSERRIAVTEEQVKRLASQWAQTWQRAPSADELDGLIRDYIKEEIYYREALRLGLDKDDMIVRRRMRSKMEFLATSEAENMTPSDAELQAWLDKRPGKYAAEPVYSLDQVYISTSGGEEAAIARAKALLKQLQGGAKFDTMGDPLSLPRTLDSASQFEINRQFGEQFALALKSLPTHAWSGPVASGFGLHLVRIRAVTSSKQTKLADVRKSVENDWREATRVKREAQAYQALLDGYKIDIEKPE
jgi:peptidyl-prolyl cis-trans isomerase C